MKLKIFCRCSLFPSWSGYGLISTPVGTVASGFVTCVQVTRWANRCLHNGSRCGSDGDMVIIVSTVPSDTVDSCVSLPKVALL